jgi:drug/metabolite transporter (DMT)-like permease
MQINIKIISHTFTPFFALYMRGFMLIVINSIFIRINHLHVDQQNKKTQFLLMIRSVISGVSVLCVMTPIAYIPIGIVNSLFNTGPIFIHFIEAFYYKKGINTVHLIFTIVCFIGILLIIKPDFIFGKV